MGLLDFFNASVTLKLDNAYVVPGGNVSGIISIQVKKSIEVHGLHLILRGKEEVTVNPYSTKNREYHSTIILNQRVNFHGGKNTKDIRNVPLGNYEYPFICPLPHDIPCTTNTRSFGSITKLSYSATAVLCIPTSPDIEVSEKFHVLSVCSQEQLKTQMPNHSNGTSHLTSCCCINKGTIKWNATLIQKLCVMGVDNFLIKLDVNNESQCKIDKVSVNLTQKTFIYRNCHHYDDVENIVRESLDFHVSPQTSGTLKIGFRVPFGLAPSKNSGLFSLQYYVKLKINVKDGSDVKIKLPVYLVEAVDETGKIPIISLEPGAVENLPHCQPQEFSYQNMNQREAPISRPMPGPASTGNTLNPPHAHNNPQIHPQIAARPINTFSAKAQYDTVPYTDKVSLELEQDRFPVEYVME